MATQKISRSAKLAARSLKKSGANIGHNARAIKKSAMISGFQQRSIVWSYKVGDLVKFRDTDGRIKYGTITLLMPNTVDIVTLVGKLRLPCQSLQLIDRLEDENEEEINLLTKLKGESNGI